jgi:flavodoxin
MSIYVVYESKRGKARRAAEAITDAAASQGVATLVRSIEETVADDVLAADALVVGCGVKVDTPFGGEPAHRVGEWIDGLPNLDGKRVGVFCTYSIFPHTFADTAARVSEVLAGLDRGIEGKRGKVVVSRSFHVREFPETATAFVGQILEYVQS